MAIDIALVVSKLVIGLATGSIGLVADSVHSGLDAAASVLAFTAIRSASRPADHDHPYGHGKAENIAAYTEGLLLVLAAAAILYEVSHRLRGGHPVAATTLAIAFVSGTILLEVVRSTILRRLFKKTGSPSIEALAADKAADLLAVTAVLAGLVTVRLGFSWGDAVAAVVVAALILWAALRLIRRAIDVLMDRSVASAERVVLEAASSVEGVQEARVARVHRAGTGFVGDVEVTGRRTLAIEAAEGLADDVRSAVLERIPEMSLNVIISAQADPSRLVERVHAAAARFAHFHDVHDVLIEREADEQLHLSLHAKLPAQMSMREASAHSTNFESALRRELPDLRRVDLHLEPLEPDLVQGRDVTNDHPDLVQRVISVATRQSRVARCDEVELSSRGGEITAYVSVRVPDDLTLEQAHDVETDLENRLRQDEGLLKDVLVRASA